MSHDFGKGLGEGADGVVLVGMNEVGEKTRAFTSDEGGWKLLAVGAVAGGVVFFTTRTEIMLLG